MKHRLGPHPFRKRTCPPVQGTSALSKQVRCKGETGSSERRSFYEAGK
jgi:hypothetical protein